MCLNTDQKIAGSNPAKSKKIFFRTYISFNSGKMFAPPGGLEPPTFQLTDKCGSQLRHGGMLETDIVFSQNL